MAVGITVAALGVELRLATSEADYADLPEGQQNLVARRLASATVEVEEYAPDAPTAIQDEALIRLAGWLYDTDPSEARRAASPLHSSGAAALLGRYRKHRLSLPSGAAGGVGGVDAGAPFDWATEGNTDPIPVQKLSLAGGAAHDQTARDAAAAAQSDADAAGATAAAANASAIAAQRSADDALAAIAALDSTYSTDAGADRGRRSRYRPPSTPSTAGAVPAPPGQRSTSTRRNRPAAPTG